MFARHAASREWTSAGYEGAERAMLRLSPDNGRTSLVRLKAGTRGKRHRHEAGEDVLVLSGRVAIGGFTLEAGDYLYTEAGEEHDLVALEDSVIYVASEKPVTVTET
jgi:quercetin dioxygenase-like cupin family protein